MTPEQLKQWRKSRSLTQEGLGMLLGVTKTCVYRWEAGLRHIPSFLHLALECLNMKGGIKPKRARKKKEKGGDD
jgi:DNA-binding XRE family transcriptional regulator